MKLAVLGLDGATFDVLDPLCAQGRLPNLAKIMQDGSRATLQSTLPAVTGPAWTALATGKNPGKTGVLDFLNPQDSDKLSHRVVDSHYIRRARAYWDYLSDAGATVGILNYPFLYPPYAVDGFMVSGLGCSPADNITYPPSLQQILFDHCGGYETQVLWQDYARDVPRFVEEIMKLLRINARSLELLLARDPDIFTVVISATDFVQHFMWRFFDPRHPLYEEENANTFAPLFVRVWEEVDHLVGSLLERVPSNCNVIIVSDHGFGPHTGNFYTNVWLRQNGYLALPDSPEPVIRRHAASILGPLARRAARLLPHKLYETLADPLRALQKPFVAQIDPENSLAYAVNHNCWMGAIFLGKSAAPSSSPGHSAHRDLWQHVVDDLQDVCEALGLTLQVYRPDDLYSGPYAALAPDVLFDLDAGACSVHYSMPTEEMYVPVDASSIDSGSHRRNGVFLAVGPEIKATSEIGGATVYDVAPTILHMFGLPVPTDMDGRVLCDIFAEKSDSAAREVRWTSPVRAQGISEQHDSVSRQEQAAIRARLRGLGYLDD